MIPGFFAAGAGGGAPPIPVSAPFFGSDPMLSSGWETVSGPSGFYHAATGRTCVAWQFVGIGGFKGVHVASYDHVAGAWSERYTAGNFLLANDDHGHPALVRDAEGYIHCFFGSHDSPQKYAVSSAPDDISSWATRPDIAGSWTYPKGVLVGSTIHLFMRNGSPSTNRRLSVLTMTPSGGSGSFSAFKNIVDFGADSRVYTTELHAVGTDIHFCSMYCPANDAYRKHVYYMVLDTVTGAVSNYDGSTTITSGSLPVTLAQANSDFRIYEHTGLNDGDVPSLQFDSYGSPHVLVANGQTPDYQLEHIMFSGGSWTPAVSIASVGDLSPESGYIGAYCLVPGASGSMEAWYNVDGNKIRRVRSSAGSWGSAEVIAVHGALDFVQGAAVLNAHADFRALYAENSGGAIDANAAKLGLFGHGASGGLNSSVPMGAIDPDGWESVVLLVSGNSRTGAATVIDDSQSSVTCTLSGNAQVSSAKSYYGRNVIQLDGTGDFVVAPNRAEFSVSGSSNVCVDFPVWLNETGRLQAIIAKRAATGGGEFQLNLAADNKLQLVFFNGGSAVLNLVGTTALSVGPMYFVEFSRIGGVTYLFVNGSLEASGTQSASPSTNSGSLLIGRDPTTSARDFNGWIPELRFTRAGRHSANYTPPSAPFPRR